MEQVFPGVKTSITYVPAFQTIFSESVSRSVLEEK